jgi:N utilization substance protein B
VNRRKSRELAMKLLFEMSVNSKSIEEAIEDYKENNVVEDDLDFDYIKRTVEGTFLKEEFLKETIEKNLTNWKYNRISKINIAIIKIAIYEMYFDEDIPDKVSINEAIELSKKYSDEKAPSFINGVLGNIIRKKEQSQ